MRSQKRISSSESSSGLFGVFTRRKYISSHYHILYYEKPGGRRAFDMGCRFGPDERDGAGGSLNYQDREDVWVINREYKPGQVKNKNELPSQLLQKMIQYSSREGDLVADFFMGGGSTCRQALALGRRFVGFEQSPKFQQRAVQAAETEFRGGLVRCGPAIPTREARTAEDQQRLGGTPCPAGDDQAAAMRILQDEFGRGRFSILNAIEVLRRRPTCSRASLHLRVAAGSRTSSARPSLQCRRVSLSSVGVDAASCPRPDGSETRPWSRRVASATHARCRHG